MDKNLIYGLIIIGIISKGLCQPQPQTLEVYDEDVPSYDDYGGDDGEHYEPKPKQDIMYTLKSSTKKEAKLGSDVLIECPVLEEQVKIHVLWYKDPLLLLVNGNSVINERFKLKNHSLILANVTKTDSGKYYCEVIPDKIRHDIELVVGSSGFRLNDSIFLTAVSLVIILLRRNIE